MAGQGRGLAALAQGGQPFGVIFQRDDAAEIQRDAGQQDGQDQAVERDIVEEGVDQAAMQDGDRQDHGAEEGGHADQETARMDHTVRAFSENRLNGRYNRAFFKAVPEVTQVCQSG